VRWATTRRWSARLLAGPPPDSVSDLTVAFDSKTGTGGRFEFLVALGLPAALFAHTVARFSERTGAIGSKTLWTEVEPTEWNVLPTRVVGAGFVLVG
jgi:hypothetical protein